MFESAYARLFHGLDPHVHRQPGEPELAVFASVPDGPDRFLVTAGLSRIALAHDEIVVTEPHVELVLVVPASVPVTAMHAYMRELAQLARFAALKAPLQPLHTVPIGGPIVPGSRCVGYAILSTANTGLQAFDAIDVPDPPTFLVAVGVAEDELLRARRDGIGAIYPSLRARDFVTT